MPNKMSGKPWELVRILDVLIAFTNYDLEFKSKNPIGFRTLKEIVDESLYPIYQAFTRPRPISWYAQYGTITRTYAQNLRYEWRQQTAKICNEVGAQVGVPKWIRNIIIDVIYEHIYNFIWDITGFLFNQPD